MRIFASRQTLRAAPRRIVPAAPDLPLHTELSWRPGIAPVDDAPVQVFHDGPTDGVTTAAETGTLRLVVSTSVESFASIAVALPAHIRGLLAARHILRLDAVLGLSRPLHGYARLNLRHGPDIDAIPRAMPLRSGRCTAEFDLATTGVGRRPLHHAWIDLIFEHPQDAEIAARDILVSCRPRAEC